MGSGSLWTGPKRRAGSPGLIRVAVCALKVAASNRRGARRLLQRGCRHLEAVMDEAAGRSFMGLDLTAFREEVDSYYRPRLEGGGAVTHDPQRYPYIVLKNEEAP